MIFLQFNEENVKLYEHSRPFDEKYGLRKSREELEEIGYLFESIPEPDEVAGKESILKLNPVDETLYYEYEDIPLTEIEEFKIEQAQANAELFEMMLILTGGMQHV